MDTLETEKCCKLVHNSSCPIISWYDIMSFEMSHIGEKWTKYLLSLCGNVYSNVSPDMVLYFQCKIVDAFLISP